MTTTSPPMRMIAAILGLVAAGAVAAACSADGGSTPAPRPSEGTEPAATMARAFRAPGIVRPPGKSPAQRAAELARHSDAKHLLNASYPATGGCGSPLEYYGGPIIANPIVVQVSWNDPGTGGTVDPTVEAYLQSWWPAIISPQAGYLAWLTEYSTVGRVGQDGAPGSNQTFGGFATYGGVFHITPSAANQGATIDDSAIGPELVAQIDAGNLPAPSFDPVTGFCNTVYMMDFPPSVTDVSLTFAGTPGNSCTDFCGYHGGTAYHGQFIYYGVLPDVTVACPSCAPDGVNQDVGMVHSHELAEAITDAEIDLENLTAISTDFVRPGGWDQIATGCSEIGDSCAWPVQAGSAVPTVTYEGQGYFVQGLFDNTRMDCEVSGPTTAGCTSNSQCTNPLLPFCNGTACQACSADSDCNGNPGGNACQPSGACGQCSATNTAACAAPTPSCNTTTGTCVQCTSNASCSGSTPICDPASNTCRACQAGDCSAPTPICETTGAQTGRCVGCATGSDCSTGVCDPATNMCIGCVGNIDCAGSTPICDTTSHTCRGCASSSECATGTAHVCDVTAGTCVGCLQNSDCTGGACNTTSHTCVSCLDNSECSNPTPICNTVGGADTCGACESDTQCAGNSQGSACSPQGACVQCTATNQAACHGSSCDTATNTCTNAGGNDGGVLPAADGGGSGGSVDSGSAEDGGEGGTGSGGGGGSGGGCAVAPARSTSNLVGVGALLLGLAIGTRRRVRQSP